MANKEFEDKYYNQGYQVIGGLDEAGRGPLAGPVVAACVVFPSSFNDEIINDSKKLSDKKRRELVNIIKENALDYSISVVDEEIIDKINIYQASRLAMMECIKKLKVNLDVALTDAMPLPDLKIKVEAIVKGDQKSLSIAAASILAKVTRDELMEEYDKVYPEYKFAKHKGYGTKEHLKAIEEFGICKIHRKTYEPIKSMLQPKLELIFDE